MRYAIRLLICIGIATVGTWAGGCQQLERSGRFVKGDSEAVLDRPTSEVTAAARGAIDDMNFIFIGADDTPKDGHAQTVLTARTRADEKITITVTPASGTSSHVVVGTGLMGDTTVRDKLLDGIKARLGPKQAAQQATQVAPATQP